MAAISQTIGNVLGGVSQQPDPVKIPGQVREAENVYLDPTFGCSKRPGTQFISKLADDIPENAKWIPIFRDDLERYIACIYDTGAGATVRVWAADSGEERTVNLRGSSSDYLQFSNLANLRALTINDYTLIVNGEKIILMNSADDAELKQEALVVVNQVSYNTTYSIDFLKDGEEQEQVKVFKATRLSVSPASFEVQDEGDCSLQDTEGFVVDGDGGQTGLGFTLTTACNPTLVTGEEQGQTYPTGVTAIKGDLKPPGNYGGRNAWWTMAVGSAATYAPGSYVYTTRNVVVPEMGTVQVRYEGQVVETPSGKRYAPISQDVVSYTIAEGGAWSTGYEWIESTTTPVDIFLTNGAVIPAGESAGFYMSVSAVSRGPSTPTYSYKSSYRTNVSLSNGGRDWSVGDEVSVSMAGKDYTIKVEQVTFGFSYASEASVNYTTAVDTESGALNVSDIVSNLVAEITALDNYTAQPIGNVIYIERDDGRVFNLQVRGGAADRALYGLKDAVNDVSLLPAQGMDGIRLKVSNSSQSDADDYYVKFVTEGGIPGQGAWEETLAPGIPVNLNNASMPHVLIRQDDGSFDMEPLSAEYDDKNFWIGREVGDEKTNPEPTFVGKSIKDCFFFMNRLGFLSDDTVVMSQAGSYFNFFQGSAIAISDADPIDMAASSTKPAKLKAAIGTPAGLLLFAENSQFLMSTEDVAFGPATVKMNEITNYSYNSTIPPVETGVSILFPTSAETFTKVFELSTDSLQARALVTENTRIIPEYIPPKLTHLTSVPNSSMVLMGTGDKDVYVFKFYNTGNERNLAGWTKWVMQTDTKLIYFAHDTGYFVGVNELDEVILSRMELIDDPETSPINAYGKSFTPRLDHYLYQDQVTAVPLGDGATTRVTVPDGFGVIGATAYLVATVQGSETFYAGGELTLNDDDGSYYFDIPNSVANSQYITGLSYTMRVSLPAFFVKSGEQNRADRRYPPMVENVYIDLYFSGRYQALVERTGYQDRLVDLEVTTADIYLANSEAIDEFATKTVSVYSRGDLSRITIIAPDPLPAAFTSYSWEGHYSTRGIASR